MLDDERSVAHSARSGSEDHPTATTSTVIGFTYYRPPIRAEVLIRDKRLVYIKCRAIRRTHRQFQRRVEGQCQMVGRALANAEWDIEVENAGVYRLCKVRDEWFLVGEYD